MTRPSLKNRSALHHKRGLHHPRAVTTAKIPDVNKPTVPVPVVDRPRETTTATSDKPDVSSLLPIIPSIDLASLLGLASTTTTSHLPSSTTSATTVPVTTSSLTTTSSVPTITSEIPHAVVQTTTTYPSSTSTHTQSPSTTAQASNGMSTATIIGVIGSALGATILLTATIAFLLRRWREKKAAEEIFDASQFRQSAALLDNTDDNTHGRPRPPSMIERRNISPTATAAPLAPPSTAYPYSDQPPALSSAFLSGIKRTQSFAQQGANQTQYGAVPLQPPSFVAGNQFGGNGSAPNAPAMHYGLNRYPTDHEQGDLFTAYAASGQSHEQSGHGAPPVPGTHGPGAYAPYGVDPRYLRYQQHAQQQKQQYGFGEGPAAPGASLTRSLTRDGNVPSLPNPFSPPASEKTEPTEGSGPRSLSTSTSSSASSNTGLARGASFVTRQPSQSHEAPPAYTSKRTYTEVKRDVKVSPPSLKVMNDGLNSAVPDTKTVSATATTKSNGCASEPRPVSSFTLYDNDDAYGGM